MNRNALNIYMISTLGGLKFRFFFLVYGGRGIFGVGEGGKWVGIELLTPNMSNPRLYHMSRWWADRLRFFLSLYFGLFEPSFCY